MKLNLQFFATKVMRYDIADYLGVTVSGTTTYYLLGVGVTKLDESPSPKTNTDAFINSRQGQTTLTGYDNSFPVDSQLIPSEAAIAALHAVARNQSIGTAAEFALVRADLYDRVGSTGTVYNARKFAVTFVPGDISGENTDMMKITGSLNQNGDLVQGTFDTTALTFSAGTQVGVIPAIALYSVPGATSGTTRLGVYPQSVTLQSYKYKTAASVALPLAGDILTTGWTAWDGLVDIAATTGNQIVVAIITTSTNAAVYAGRATVVSKA